MCLEEDKNGQTAYSADRPFLITFHCVLLADDPCSHEKDQSENLFLSVRTHQILAQTGGALKARDLLCKSCVGVSSATITSFQA